MNEHGLHTQYRVERPLERWRNGVAFYQEASARGLAPVLVSADEEQLTAQRCEPLILWLGRFPGRRDEMARALIARIKELHSCGICHRDVYDGNVLVRDDDVPVFIDFELATHADPSAPCYDLCGPGPSGVAVPAAHAAQVGSRNENGVYWDNAEHPSLSTIFGPVASFESTE
jgi:hypothetical protein